MTNASFLFIVGYSFFYISNYVFTLDTKILFSLVKDALIFGGSLSSLAIFFNVILLSQLKNELQTVLPAQDWLIRPYQEKTFKVKARIQEVQQFILNDIAWLQQIERLNNETGERITATTNASKLFQGEMIEIKLTEESHSTAVWIKSSIKNKTLLLDGGKSIKNIMTFYSDLKRVFDITPSDISP